MVSVKSLAKHLGSAVLAATVVEFVKKIGERKSANLPGIGDLAQQIIDSFDHDLEKNEVIIIHRVLSRSDVLIEFINFLSDDGSIQEEDQYNRTLNSLRSKDKKIASQIEITVNRFNFAEHRNKFVNGLIDVRESEIISFVSKYLVRDRQGDRDAYRDLVTRFGIEYSEAQDLAYGSYKFLERKATNRALERLGSEPWTARVTDYL